MIYSLPESVEIDGTEYAINSDFRCILDIMEVLSDEELTDQERGYLALGFFYPDFSSMPKEHMKTAIEKVMWFIGGGKADNPGKKQPVRLMDWEQDFPLIIGPVNKVIGHEIRSDDHCHWWTFLSAYMDLGECLFSHVIGIRQKLASGKRLDKADREWYAKNKDLVDLKKKAGTRFTAAELEFLSGIK